MTENEQTENQKNTELTKKITKLLVLNNEELKPFIEVFEFSGENIIQQPLGKIFGVFEIKDESDYSAFIVNFLTSTLKKEYFINPQRNAEESLESALNKVNKALSELANQNNVNWMGKLDAAIAVVDKKNLYFSVTGQAKILIIRNKQLIDISAGLASPEAGFHPLKTFVDISSGALMDGDTIIVTTDDLFHVFSLEQLAKGAKRFNGEKFIQFINTGLINELPIAGTIIIDIIAREKQPDKLLKTDEYYDEEFKLNENVNYFSQDAFAKEKTKTEAIQSADFYAEEKDTATVDEKSSNQFVDKRTGHIYIKDDGNDSSQTGIYSEITSKVFARVKKVSKQDKFKSADSSKKLIKGKQFFAKCIEVFKPLFNKFLQLIKRLPQKIKETYKTR